jgi:hypothetical protein
MTVYEDILDLEDTADDQLDGCITWVCHGGTDPLEWFL